MPHCYFVNDYRQSELTVIDSKPPERADHGLPPLPTPALAGDDGNDDGGGGGGGAGVARWAKSRARGRDEATSAVPGQRQRGGGASAGGGDGAAVGTGAAAAEAGADDCSPVVLCNFNRLHKIDPHTFGAWMEVSSRQEQPQRDRGWLSKKDAAIVLWVYISYLFFLGVSGCCAPKKCHVSCSGFNTEHLSI